MRLKAKMLVFMPGREVKRYVHVYTRKDGSESAQWVGPEDFKTGEGLKLYPGLVKEDRFVFTDQFTESMFRRFYKPKRLAFKVRTKQAVNDRLRDYGLMKSTQTEAGKAALSRYNKKEYPFEQ